MNPTYRATLILCAGLNLGMFAAELSVGFVVGSAALLADAVDFLEDGCMLSLAVAALAWSRHRRAAAGGIMGALMLCVGLSALAQVLWRLVYGGSPAAAPIALTALAALGVNAFCALRLASHRSGDTGMRAVWLSTRNDAVLNVVTLFAAGLIALTGRAWPDLAAGLLIAAINLATAGEILVSARREAGTRV